MFHALYDAQGPDVYTVQLELELEGALDAGVLEASLQAVVGRHASLRAGFRHERLEPSGAGGAGAGRGAVAADRSVGAAREREQQQRLTEIVAADRLERFDVAAPPLLRFALIRLGAQRHRLLISNHHLLMDGWSAPILVRELLEAYGRGGSADGAAAGDAVPRLSGVDRRGRTGAAGLAAFRRQRCPGSRKARGLRRATAGPAQAAWRRSRSCCRWARTLSAALNRHGARAGGDAQHACCRRPGACCSAG